MPEPLHWQWHILEMESCFKAGQGSLGVKAKPCKTQSYWLMVSISCVISIMFFRNAWDGEWGATGIIWNLVQWVQHDPTIGPEEVWMAHAS